MATRALYLLLLLLQEVTPFILELFINMDWWSQYHCCPPPGDAPYFTLLLVHKAAAPGVSSSSFRERPFYNSVMGKIPVVTTVDLHLCIGRSLRLVVQLYFDVRQCCSVGCVPTGLDGFAFEQMHAECTAQCLVCKPEYICTFFCRVQPAYCRPQSAQYYQQYCWFTHTGCHQPPREPHTTR